jgi:phosphoglycerate dehydrogenase-like enzyme
VTNTPDALTDATADIAMLLIMMACRRAAKASGSCAPVSGRAGTPPICWARP